MIAGALFDRACARLAPSQLLLIGSICNLGRPRAIAAMAPVPRRLPRRPMAGSESAYLRYLDGGLSLRAWSCLAHAKTRKSPGLVMPEPFFLLDEPEICGPE